MPMVSIAAPSGALCLGNSEKETERLVSFGETYQPVLVCGGNELRKDGGGSVSGLSSQEETLRQTRGRHRKSCLCHQMSI